MPHLTHAFLFVGALGLSALLVTSALAFNSGALIGLGATAAFTGTSRK